MHGDAKGRSPREVFSEIYERRIWGGDASRDFDSGAGSHDPTVVAAYVDAVTRLASAIGRTLDAVDLGCGDFNVGSQLRHLFGGYVACDVVPSLIERNRAVYAALGVDFRCLDIVADDLPPGDIVFVRQVLQHLSNADVQRLVEKLHPYKFLVLTEHVPARPGFAPNVDQATGAGTRLQTGSGVVLTAAPFALRARAERTLCEVHGYGGVIRTIAYQLR
jgi:hypothetical protein